MTIVGITSNIITRNPVFRTIVVLLLIIKTKNNDKSKLGVANS
jgi:hypothetical protein